MEDKNVTELEFVEKPLRKPDRRIYGRMETWQDSDFQQFIPVAHGTGTKREVMKSLGRTKLIKNTGENQSSYSLLANVDAKDEHFADSLSEDVNRLLKPYLKNEPKLPSARFLLDEPNLKIWKSRERGKLVIHCEYDSSSGRAILSNKWNSTSVEVMKFINSSEHIKK